MNYFIFLFSHACSCTKKFSEAREKKLIKNWRKRKEKKKVKNQQVEAEMKTDRTENLKRKQGSWKEQVKNSKRQKVKSGGRSPSEMF